MNNKSRCKVLLKALNVMYDTCPDTRDFYNKSLTEICINENQPVEHVFSVCFGFICCCLYFLKLVAVFIKGLVMINELLCIIMTNQKVKYYFSL